MASLSTCVRSYFYTVRVAGLSMLMIDSNLIFILIKEDGIYCNLNFLMENFELNIVIYLYGAFEVSYEFVWMIMVHKLVCCWL